MTWLAVRALYVYDNGIHCLSWPYPAFEFISERDIILLLKHLQLQFNEIYYRITIHIHIRCERTHEHRTMIVTVFHSFHFLCRPISSSGCSPLKIDRGKKRRAILWGGRAHSFDFFALNFGPKCWQTSKTFRQDAFHVNLLLLRVHLIERSHWVQCIALIIS